jgi:hypothetical protein
MRWTQALAGTEFSGEIIKAENGMRVVLKRFLS